MFVPALRGLSISDYESMPSPGSTDLRTVVQIRNSQPNSSASYSDKPSMRHPVPLQHLDEGQPQDTNVKPQGLALQIGHI